MPSKPPTRPHVLTPPPSERVGFVLTTLGTYLLGFVWGLVIGAAVVWLVLR